MNQKPNLIQGQGTPFSAWQCSSELANIPAITVAELLPPGSRVVIVAPHPDDEILGCGGLLAQIAHHDVTVRIVAVTDGEGSHSHSADWPVDRLRHERPLESRLALHRLGLSLSEVQWTRLHLNDSDVARDEAALVAVLARCFEASTHVITTWREDGHCDHEAVGRACALAAKAKDCQLYEVPVWAWHWAAPGDSRLPWARARKLDLDTDALVRKRTAIQAHRSQLLPDASTGAKPILADSTLAHFTQPHEIFFI
ncbi:PIG-L deacetylase family protein [Pseudomonas sp. EL_65y_Pfl2_R95]|uniref:PIG-L deacetylase family protein n=1 Tax=Pseudomonas sp. EL_65y_Pfl2_R95 TaxID=3088698 RepID=UPI0030DD79E9